MKTGPSLSWNAAGPAQQRLRRCVKEAGSAREIGENDQSQAADECSAEAGAHSELFKVESTAWSTFDAPELLGSSTTFWANKVAPRAAVRELCMSDAEEFRLIAERYAGPLILKPRCFVPDFDGAFLSSDSKDALWDRFYTGAP
jgi:hypothetical protein